MIYPKPDEIQNFQPGLGTSQVITVASSGAIESAALDEWAWYVAWASVPVHWCLLRAGAGAASTTDLPWPANELTPPFQARSGTDTIGLKRVAAESTAGTAYICHLVEGWRTS